MTAFRKTRLPNGVRVVSENHSRSRAVSLGIWVTTGTRDENADQAGISHLIEHLVFKGTKTRNAYQIARALESLGGDLNAFTTKEYTCYHALVLKEHWSQALDVVSDLVCNMSVAPKDFKLEKGVILQEIAMADDAPEDVIHERLFEGVYGSSRLAKPILGNIKSIVEMKAADVNRHYREAYTGDRLIVAAAGPVDHDRLVEEVAKRLKSRKPSNETLRRRAPSWKAARGLIDKEGEQIHALWAFPTVSFKSERRFEAFILNAALGGGMTSRLYQAVRERKGLVYTIHSSLNTFNDAGLITIYAGVDLPKVAQVSKIIAAELIRLKERGLSRADIELFKTQIIGGILLGADDVENRMNSIALNEMVFGRYRPVEEIVEKIRTVSPESFHQFLEDEFHPEQTAAFLVGPEVSQCAGWWNEMSYGGSKR